SRRSDIGGGEAWSSRHSWQADCRERGEGERGRKVGWRGRLFGSRGKYTREGCKARTADPKQEAAVLDAEKYSVQFSLTKRAKTLLSNAGHPYTISPAEPLALSTTVHVEHRASDKIGEKLAT
ncbi:unnamed protein product, partial [Ectocarpus sp. 12 AP-2014]